MSICQIIMSTCQKIRWQLRALTWYKQDIKVLVVMILFWQVDIMIWQVDIHYRQVKIKIWQVDIIIWQVMAEICHYSIGIKSKFRINREDTIYDTYFMPTVKNLLSHIWVLSILLTDLDASQIFLTLLSAFFAICHPAKLIKSPL